MGKQNLVKADRAENMKRFQNPKFKKVAHVIMGEPKSDFKARVHKKLLEEKQEKENKRKMEARQKQLQEMHKKTMEKKKEMEEAKKKAEEEKKATEEKAKEG